MHLIVGLGNPGDKYTNTRHNVGFRAIFSLAKKLKIKSTSFKLRSIIGKGFIGENRVILAQPQTYMNNSGEAVGLLANYYNVPLENILVIYDDLDLPTGKIRIKKRGSAGGHKGLKSIIKIMGSNDIPRIRIGIDRPLDGIEVFDYVLGYFNQKEEKQIDQAIQLTVDAVITIFEDGFQAAMNEYN